MTLEDTKKFLDKGDYVKIARMAELSPGTRGRQYVYEVINGRRKAIRGKAKKVIECAIVMAKQNIKNGKTVE